jgi:chorismate dehydratase
MRIGRIPYINCFPVYRGIDKGIVRLEGTLVSGVPTALNEMMALGELDVSVVSVVELATRADRYFLLPDLAISCDGPVRSVLLLSTRPAEELDGRTVIVSRSSMTSVALLALLFRHLWRCQPSFAPGDAELSDVAALSTPDHDARLVIGDAALHISSRRSPNYEYHYDLGEQWKLWTGLPFVFAVWVCQRSAAAASALATHGALLASREWGLANLDILAREAAENSGLPERICHDYLDGLDYGLSSSHQAGLRDFFRRLALDGVIAGGDVSFLPAA